MLLLKNKLVKKVFSLEYFIKLVMNISTCAEKNNVSDEISKKKRI